MNPKKSLLAIASLVLVVLALAACGGGGSSSGSASSSAASSSSGSSDATTAADSSGSEPTKIRYQTVVGFVNPLEMAGVLGYLGNLELDPVGATTSGPETIQAVATNQIDVAGAFNAAIIKLIAQGGEVTSVVGYSGSDEKSYESLLVTEGSSIQNAHDLVDKKVGVNTFGGAYEAWTKIWRKKEGLSQGEIEEVEFVQVPPTDAEQNLRHGQVDAIVLSGELLELAVGNGGLRTVEKDIEVLGPYNASSFVLRNDFIEEDPRDAATLTAGIAKAIAFMQAEPTSKVIKVADEAAEQFGRPEDVESLKLWKSNGVPNKGGVIDPKEFSTWTTLLEEEGELEPGKFKPTDFYTNKLNPFAKEGQ